MEIYRGLQYRELRQAHDQVYFGAWRGLSPTVADLKDAQHQLEEFLDALERELQEATPPGTKDYLARAREASRQIDPEGCTGSAVLLAINNTLSYGHRVLDYLLRAQGQANHNSRAFAGYYDLAGDGDE